MPQDVEILVEPYEEESADLIARWREVLVRHDRIREYFGDVDPATLRVFGPELPGRKRDRSSPFVATVFDPRESRAVEVRGRLDAEEFDVVSSSFQPNPSGEELRAAVEILRAGEDFAGMRERDDVVVYQPMPPLSDVERDDGTVVRRVGLASRGAARSKTHFRSPAVGTANSVTNSGSAPVWTRSIPRRTLAWRSKSGRATIWNAVR